MLKKKLFLSVSVIFSINAFASDLGNVGQSFLIIEKDAISLLKDTVNQKLANGGKDKLVFDAQKRFFNKLSNIQAPDGVTTVTENKIRVVDLTEVVNKDILDNKNNVIVRKGTALNPLKNKPLDKKVFFIDGRNQEQLVFAKANAKANDKIILVAGNLWTSQEFLERNVFLEMGLVHKMHIQATPSIASQGDGFKLQIEEYKL